MQIDGRIPALVLQIYRFPENCWTQLRHALLPYWIAPLIMTSKLLNYTYTHTRSIPPPYLQHPEVGTHWSQSVPVQPELHLHVNTMQSITLNTISSSENSNGRGLQALVGSVTVSSNWMTATGADSCSQRKNKCILLISNNIWQLKVANYSACMHSVQSDATYAAR